MPPRRAQNPLRRTHLDEFVASCKRDQPGSERTGGGRFRSFTYDELVARDQAKLDVTWLRDASLEDLDDPPATEIRWRTCRPDGTGIAIHPPLRM